MTSRHRVVLLRHGETEGYSDDLGLTDLGEAQARDRGQALAKELAIAPPGTYVRLPHAPTARGTATAVTLRAALTDALGPDHGLVVGALEPDPHFDSLRFFHGGRARESSAVAADKLALRGERPDWAAEFDRFDSDHGELSRLGGPIDRWLTSTTRFFEPPQVAVYRLWAGIAAIGRTSDDDGIALVSTHSGPMRAFAAAAVGHDPGEPANLEAVDVVLDGPAATITYREHRVVVEVPDAVPPWIDPAYLDGPGGAVRS